jgi:PAS domain S-box-containing protein
MDMKGTVDLARALQPDLRTVVVIGGGSDADYFEAMTRRQLAGERGISVTYLIDRPMDEWLSHVATLRPGSAVLYLSVYEDGDKRRVVPTDVLYQLSRASAAPVYGVLAHHLDHGIVGGSVLDVEILAHEIAAMSQRVLQGESARNIPVTDTRSVSLKVSWPEMRRRGLSQSRLPTGAIVLHQEPSILQQYRWPIVGAFSVVIVQAVTIAGLVMQRRRRRESEERTLAILRAVPDAMFLQTREGVYIDYHAYDPANLVFPPEKFLGRHMRDVLPERLVAPLKEALDEALRRAPEPVTVEYWLEVPGGMRHFEKRIVRCSGNRLLSVVRDTTQRKRAEHALQQSQERYALATTAGSVGVWEWNPATDAFFVDSSLAALGFGANGEMRVDDWFARIHPDDRDRVVSRLRSHVATDGPPYEDEHRVVDAAGRVRWCLTRGSVIGRSNGQATRMTGTCTDITARKQAEEALHRAHAELARLHRITTLSEVTAALAHEINQPLTAILSNATACLRWLGRPSPDLVEMREALQDVARDARRANEVVVHTRRLFARQDVEKAPLDVNSLVREACVLAHERLQSGRVRVRTSLARDLPTVQGNRIELQQAIWNLILNAIDAMREATLRRVTIETSFDGQAVKVSVHDTGCGVDEDQCERVFDPFYTTKPSGMGMGLSISRSIVEAHRGQLWIEQNGAAGATFCFTLPVPAAVGGAARATTVAERARTELVRGA